MPARRPIAAALVALLLLPLLVLAGGPASAADSTRFSWDAEGSQYKVFDGNQSISIYSGTVGHCNDLIYNSANVYIVPTGVLDGQELKDVGGGDPNIVEGMAAGGLFMGETIGATFGKHMIPNGLYAVVYDECEDGTYDAGTDFVVDPAFRVQITGDAPPLAPELLQLKAAARGQQIG